MSISFDPEAIYQDADIEMIEMAEAATDNRDPWKECDWCPSGNQTATATIDILIGTSTKTIPYCPTHEPAARHDKADYDEMMKGRRHVK